jgi:hypothetical protein
MRLELDGLVTNSWILVSRGLDENFLCRCVWNVNTPIPLPAVNPS